MTTESLSSLRTMRRNDIPARLEMLSEADLMLERKHSRYKWTLALGLAVAAAVVVGVWKAKNFGGMFPFICSVIIIPIAFSDFRRRRTCLNERQANLRFAKGLLANLRLEVHPRKQMRWSFSGADGSVESEQLSRTTYSPHGNMKEYYNHSWFQLDATLADGSRVRIKTKRKVKTKKGSRMHNRRYLVVRLFPFAARLDHGRIHRELNDAITASFHDPPEGISYRKIEKAGRAGVRVEVLQMDAEFWAEEVSAVLRGLYAVLEPVSLSEGPL